VFENGVLRGIFGFKRDEVKRSGENYMCVCVCVVFVCVCAGERKVLLLCSVMSTLPVMSKKCFIMFKHFKHSGML